MAAICRIALANGQWTTMNSQRPIGREKQVSVPVTGVESNANRIALPTDTGTDTYSLLNSCNS